MSDKYREAYLFRVQYQTHRNMNQALKEIRALRKAKKVQVSGFKIDPTSDIQYWTDTKLINCIIYFFIAIGEIRRGANGHICGPEDGPCDVLEIWVP